MVQTSPRTGERPPSATRNGQPNGEPEAEAPDRHHGFVPPPGPVALLAATLVVVALGALYFFNQALFVGTDNAIVTGAIVQLGSPTNGQIRTLNVDLGDEVVRGEVVATVALATPQNQPQAPVTHAQVRSPIDGVVVARHISQGDAVTAGRPIVSIVDPSRLWIQANVDEGYVGRVRVGHSAEVTLPSLGLVLNGHVAAIAPASTAATAQLLQGSGGPGAPRGIATVPVRVDLDADEAPLVLGSSASVRIRVQD